MTRAPHPSLEPFARAGDAAFAVDAEGRIVLWNSAIEQLLGYPAGEVLGRLCHDVVHGRDTTCHYFCAENCSVKAGILSGAPVQNYDILTAHMDGRDVWVNVSVIGVAGSSGAPPYTVHILRDITEQRRKEQVLGDILKHLDGRIILTPEQSEAAAPASTHPHEALTRREHQVLELLASGFDAKDIAIKLRISPFTARNHVQSILTKLGVHSTSQAVAYAYKNRLLDPTPS